jgi:hypothetical protein
MITRSDFGWQIDVGARIFADASASPHRDVVGSSKHFNGDDARVG